MGLMSVLMRYDVERGDLRDDVKGDVNEKVTVADSVRIRAWFFVWICN